MANSYLKLTPDQYVAPSGAEAFDWMGPFATLDELSAAMGARSSAWVPGRAGKVLVDGEYLEYIVTPSKTLERRTPVSKTYTSTATISSSTFASKMPDGKAINVH